ncbi:MAG: GDSL-type esterase/lipase family protein, partial [Flammeovirgaceae bacterium]
KDIIQRKPSKLFLLIGINDLSRNTPNEVIIKNIFNMVHRVREGSPGTAIFVQSILPLNERFQNFPEQFKNKQQHVAAINGQLAKYAEKLKFTFIDLHSRFVDKNGNLEAKFATDGLHLSAVGYQHWAEILKLYIKN